MRFKVWLILVASIFAIAFAQSDPVSVALHVEALNAQGQWEEATAANPGTTVRYTLTATNEGSTTLPAGIVVVTGTVLEGVALAEVEPVPSHEVHVEYEVASGRFVSTVQRLEEVTAVRWTVMEPFEAGARVQLRYLVTIDGGMSPVPPTGSPVTLDGALAALTECVGVGNDIARLECFDAFMAAYGVTGIGSSPSAPSTPSGRSNTRDGDGFEILSSGSRRTSSGRLEVFGELRNVSNQAAGVQLEIVIRDARGALIDSATFWPASINNISPGGTRGFSWAFDIGSEAASFDVQVVETTTW